jgi:ArsR family transcriptional regulator, arsenate/arsenite/antimonite-responsive transcriptional repressor
MAADLAFEALADPVRRAVLAERSECSAGELAEQIDTVGRTAVPSRLRVLWVAGLVMERCQGRFRYYSVDATGPAGDAIRVLRSLFEESLKVARLAVTERDENVVRSGSHRAG